MSTKRSSLNQFNIEEKEQYQDQEKRDQFRKFYDNREQSMKAYVAKKSENQEISNQSQEKVFENIDSTEENDRDDQNDQFVYNLNINFSEICRKCDVKRKIFKSNNAFHSHIRACKDDEIKMNILVSTYLPRYEDTMLHRV
jgi:superfamily II helicase